MTSPTTTMAPIEIDPRPEASAFLVVEVETGGGGVAELEGPASVREAVAETLVGSKVTSK